MAQALKTLLAMATMAGALLCSAAGAQSVSDPTRPPAAMHVPVRSPDGVVVAAPVRAEPRLQSVLVSLRPGGRRVAVIDGKMVRQGQRVGGATVVAIGEREVVLRRGSTTETLKLFRPASRVAIVQP